MLLSEASPFGITQAPRHRGNVPNQPMKGIYRGEQEASAVTTAHL